MESVSGATPDIEVDITLIIHRRKDIPFAGIIYSAIGDHDINDLRQYKYIRKLAGEGFFRSGRHVQPGERIDRIKEEFTQTKERSRLGIQQELVDYKLLTKTEVGKLYKRQLEDEIDDLKKRRNKSQSEKDRRNELENELKIWKRYKWPKSNEGLD